MYTISLLEWCEFGSFGFRCRVSGFGFRVRWCRLVVSMVVSGMGVDFGVRC